MPKTEAALRAQKKYTQTEKGKKAVEKARKKQATTEEYRAYQREKQKEYRRRRKLEANGKDVETSINTEVVVPAKVKLRLPQIEVTPELESAVRSLPDTSAWLRRVITEAAERELLQSDQDGGRGVA